MFTFFTGSTTLTHMKKIEQISDATDDLLGWRWNIRGLRYRYPYILLILKFYPYIFYFKSKKSKYIYMYMDIYIDRCKKI